VLEPPPVVVADTLVIGLVGDQADFRRSLFLFTRAGLVIRPLGQDVGSFFHDISVSPDGRYLLYLGFDTLAHHEFAAVRSLQTDSVVVRSGPTPSCDCDVDLHHAHWVSADSFELVTQVDTLRWERVAGSAGRRSVRADTIMGEPRWHPR
jgi:hypothetical protein